MSLKQQLKQLNQLSQPNSSWVAKNRVELLTQIKNPHPSCGCGFKPQLGCGFFSLFQFYPRLAISLAAVILIFIGSAGLSTAAKNSLPGDRLYPVKLALERTGVQMVPDSSVKTKIQIELASERLAETKKVAAMSKTSQESDKVNQGLNQFKLHLDQAAKNLDPEQVSRTTPKQAAEMSRLMVKKNKEYKQELEKAVWDLPEVAKEKMTEAKKSVDDSYLKAMEVMAASSKLGGAGTEEVANEIKEKLSETEGAVQQAEQKAIEFYIIKKRNGRPTVSLSPLLSADKAKEALSEAKERLEAQDLTGAVSKVKEGMEQLNELNKLE